MGKVGALIGIGAVVLVGLARCGSKVGDEAVSVAAKSGDTTLGGRNADLIADGGRVSDDIGELGANYKRFRSTSEWRAMGTDKFKWAERQAPAVISVVPRTADEFKSMYGFAPTGAMQRELMSHYGIIAGLGKFADIADQSDLLARISEAGKDPESSWVIVSGHTVQSGEQKYLIGPDGTQVSHESIKSTGERAGIDVVLLTCHTDDLSYRGEVTLREATTMLSIIASVDTVTDSAQGVCYALSIAHDVSKLKKPMIVASLGAGGASYYALSSEDE